MAKYDVLVEAFNGVIHGVEVLSHEAATEKWGEWGKKHGYSSYEKFLRAVAQGLKIQELRWYEDVEVQVGENEIVDRTLMLRMNGKLKDINSFCGAVGELSNTYDLDCDFI